MAVFVHTQYFVFLQCFHVSGITYVSQTDPPICLTVIIHELWWCPELFLFVIEADGKCMYILLSYKLISCNWRTKKKSGKPQKKNRKERQTRGDKINRRSLSVMRWDQPDKGTRKEACCRPSFQLDLDSQPTPCTETWVMELGGASWKTWKWKVGREVVGL